MNKNYNEFIEIMKRLRDKEHGCPWDSVQTHESLKPSLIEEACEVVAGINILKETGDASSLKEELGDLFMGIVLQALIAEEEGLFTLEDIYENVSQKMIRRHPHVFKCEQEADVSGTSVEQVLKTWDEIKKEEKSGKEWVDSYLPAGFEESKALIDEAAERKRRKALKKA